LGWHHKDDPVLLEPPQIAASQKAFSKDDRVQAGNAGR
jgi:hypothetical protein